MKFLVVFAALVVFGACAEDACYLSVVKACSHLKLKEGTTTDEIHDLTTCNAKYGAIDDINMDLQKFALAHIAHSFDYLLMSTYFGNYEANRGGFEHLFRKLSDSTWNDAIDLIKHMAKRGGGMDFNADSGIASVATDTYEMDELQSMGRALDSQKKLAGAAHTIHGAVTRHRPAFHDPEIASFLENNFVHKHADSIRELAGHSSDLKRLIQKSTDTSLALFLFDEYLQKL